MQRRTERVVLWLLAVVVAALCARAALWQYQRAEWKQHYLQTWQAAIDSRPQPLHGADLAQGLQVPKRVEARLQRHAERWMLLDNQQREGQVGLRAYALYAAPGQQSLLVDFGWIAMPVGRSLPELAPPPPELHAEGMLLPWPGQGIALGANRWAADQSPVLLTYLDREEIGQQLQSRPADAILRLSAAAVEDLPLVQDAVALPNTLSPDQHYGYALQWAGFAVTVLAIAVILQIRSARK